MFVVTGAGKCTSREKLYNELGWESLNLRQWSRRLTLFYKIVNNLIPNYTRNPVPHPHESNYDLRINAAIGQILARTQAFKSSFYPHYLSEWDRLDPDIRLSSSVNIFKKKLLSILRPPPKFVYRIHDPTATCWAK